MPPCASRTSSEWCVTREKKRRLSLYYAAYAIEGVCVGLFLAVVLASLSSAMSLFNGGERTQRARARVWWCVWGECARVFAAAARSRQTQAAGIPLE